MIKQFKYKNITWVDVNSPTKEDVDQLAVDYKLHPIAAAELLENSVRSKVDVYDDFIYLILHFPNHRLTNGDHEDQKDTHEIDFIIGQDFIITASYDHFEPLDEFSKFLEVHPILDKSKKNVHAGYLFFHILRHLYQSLESGLDSINFNLKKAEKNIFSGKEKEMVMVLSNINRHLLDFRWSIKSHKETLVSMELAGKQFFGENFSYYLHAMIGEFEKIWNQLENIRETFFDLRNTNESLLSIKTNETMKNLTMMAFVTFPLTLIATIASIESPSNPILGQVNDFWIILVIMGGILLSMLAFFKIKRWI